MNLWSGLPCFLGLSSESSQLQLLLRAPALFLSPETRSSLCQLLNVCEWIDFLPKDWVPQLCLFSGLGVVEGELSCPGRGWSGVGSQRGLTALLSLRNPFGLPLPWGAEARASTQAHRSVLPQLWVDLTQGWRLSGLRQ